MEAKAQPRSQQKPKSKLENFKKGMQPRTKEIKFILNRVKSSPLSIAGFILIAFNAIIAIFAPVLAPPKAYDPYLIPTDPVLGYRIDPLPPSPTHPFGTTYLSVDLYYGCIWGARFAFQIGLEIISATLLVGLILGMLAGYYGGLIDELIMRFTDIILAFPGLILAMAFVATLNKAGWTTLNAALLSIMLIGWPGYTRLIRGEVLRVKTEDYIEAAKASGASDLRIMFRHILPNSIYSLIVVVTLDFGGIVLTAAALSFLGLGAPPRYADWGKLIYDSLGYVSQGFAYWWVYTIPGLFIVLFVLGWNLLGDALRDVLDPLYRRK
jgi:peptide/nickel transport system permease protein